MRLHCKAQGRCDIIHPVCEAQLFGHVAIVVGDCLFDVLIVT